MTTPAFLTISKKSKKFALTKLFVSITLASCALIQISGCQSLARSAPQDDKHQALLGANTNHAFAQVDAFHDQVAKAQLIAATSELLKRDRSSQMVIYQQEQALRTSVVNAGSDPLAMTAIKMMEYDPHKSQSKGYRSMSDITRDRDAPMLRYYDEIAGHTPEHAISIGQFEDSEYAQVQQDLRAIDLALFHCVDAHKSAFEKRRNSSAIVQTSRFQSRHDKLSECVQTSYAKLDEITPRLQSYQVQDAAELRRCAADHVRNVNEVFAVRQARGEDLVFGLNVAAAGYLDCNSKFVNQSNSDPARFVLEGYPESLLSYANDDIVCAENYGIAEQALRDAGKRYTHDAQLFAEIHYGATYCSAQAAARHLEYTPAGIPTSLAEADSMNSAISGAIFAKMHNVNHGIEEGADTNERKGWIATFFDRYRQMKQAEMTDDQPSQTGDFGSLKDIYGQDAKGGMFGRAMDVIKLLRRTNEQIKARNLYQYHPSKITITNIHRPSQRQLASLVQFDYQSATAAQLIKVPVVLDFEAGSVRGDVSAGLPLLALISPKHALYAQDFDSQAQGVIDFRLPKELEGLIPTRVIYDSLQRAIPLALGELSAHAYTPVAVHDDAFAKSVGATRAIKLHFGAKEQGEYLSAITKVLIKDLSAYVESHSERYSLASDTEGTEVAVPTPDTKTSISKRLTPERIKTIIENWALIDKGYISNDVGGLLQAVEGILPVSLYQSQYYYLNAQGRLVGQLVKSDLDSFMTNSGYQMLMQIRYDVSGAEIDELTQLIHAPAKDGNAWLASIKRAREDRQAAAEARSSYHSSQKQAQYKSEQQQKINPDHETKANHEPK